MANKLILQQRAAVNYATTIKVPDKRLWGCYPLDGDSRDLSRYNNSFAWTQFTSEQGTMFGTGIAARFSNVVTQTPPTGLNIADTWTVDVCKIERGWYLYFSNSCYIKNDNELLYFVHNNVTSPCLFGPFQQGWHHWAVTGDGEYIRVFLDGSLKYSDAVAEIDTTDPLWIKTKLSNPYNSLSCMCNLRIIKGVAMHKYVDGRYIFPVPTGYYTGLEKLD